jgi:NTE family protein
MKQICFCLLFLPVVAMAQPGQVYKNLVFEGGGVRGMAYAGAIKTLEEKGILQNIERTAGSSAGAIAALVVSLNYTAMEIDSIMSGLKVEQFNDGGGSVLGGIKRLKKMYGWYRGNAFERWLEKVIEYKTGNPNLNFNDLHELMHTKKGIRDFYCTGTNITRQRVEVFSYASTPSMPLKTAVRISCSIPLYFEPVFIDSLGLEVKKPLPGHRYQLYVDGGMIANYPISIFDTCACHGNALTCSHAKFNPETIGLKLERPEQIEQFKQSDDIPAYTVSSFNEYLKAFSNLLIETLNRRDDMANEKGRTIYISYGDINSKVRKMKVEEKRLLFGNGEKAAIAFLEKDINKTANGIGATK